MGAFQPFSREMKEFAVHERFSKATVFAKGGSVVGKAFDKEANEYVAMKAHFDIGLHFFRAIFAVRDIKYLSKLKHENILTLKNVIGPKNVLNLNYIILHMELMEDNLRHFVTSLPSAPRADRIRQWMFQIMNGLCYIHSAGLVHRDLKANNILISQSGNVLKIADFDHTRKLGEEIPSDLTEVATTAEVQAPECAVKPGEYSYAIDVWALGCILYFLFQKKLLFQPRTNRHVLREILSVIGSLNEDDVKDIQDVQVKKKLLEFTKNSRVNWKEKLPEDAPESASDLLSKMLQFHDGNRIKLIDAFYHEFFNSERTSSWVPPRYSGPEIFHYSYQLPQRLVQLLLLDSITLDNTTSFVDTTDKRETTDVV